MHILSVWILRGKNLTKYRIHTIIIHPHTSPVEEVLHNGHKGGHLAKDEHTMVGSSELGQHSIKNLKLP